MHSVGTPALWVGFMALVVVMLALDLGVFHKKAHAVSYKEAAIWSGVWVALALGFNLLVWRTSGSDPALEFLTGYLIEKSLSVDNIFVFLVIFTALKIPALHQHRILYWGILTALVLRAVMIFAGTAMLARFHWLFYVFGVFLIGTGVKLFLHRAEREPNIEKGWAFRTMRRVIPSTPTLHGSHFTAVEQGRRVATPLLLTLILIEIADVMFAVDSIPAVFAVTTDPFIVFTSNIFAILGLRSLFFLVARMMDRFHHLKVGLAAVLTFVGVKMTIADFFKIPALISLAVVATILGASIVASVWRSRRSHGPGVPPGRPAPHFGRRRDSHG